MTTISWPTKDPSESLVREWDFSSRLNAGETISGVVVAVSLLAGADPNPATMLLSAATIAGGVVSQPVRGGVHGAAYKFRCVATLAPSGRVLVLAATLQVRTA